jgi:excisionase family DNA binding protein
MKAEPLQSSVLLSPAQLARNLGLSVFTVYRLAESRKIPHFRLGSGHGCIRFDPAELDRWLQGQHVAAKDETRRLRKRP